MGNLKEVLEIERLRRVSPGEEPFTLRLEWRDGREQMVDLTGLVARSLHFRVFAKNQDAFRAVNVINWGDGVGWDNGLDYAAENLARIAEEQSGMTEEDFVEWQTSLELSNQEAADALGYSLSRIKNFRSGAPIPTAVQIACRTMLRDPSALAAHFRPRRVGRPRKPA